MDKPTILITGGSSGIGLELSKLFAKEQYRILCVAKPPEEITQARIILLDEFPTIEFHAIAKDLSKQGAALEVFEWTQQNNWSLDILINNAGFGTYGFINDINLEKETDMIGLNVICMYQLTRLFLSGMVKKNAGKILNISSVSAFQPNPGLSTYGATKAFVYSFSRAINFELKEKGSKVQVSTVCPTPVNTGFQKRAEMEDSKLFDSWMTVSAQKVAKEAYNILHSSQDMVIPGKGFHWLNKIVRRLPSSFLMKFAAKELKTKS